MLTTLLLSVLAVTSCFGQQPAQTQLLSKYYTLAQPQAAVLPLTEVIHLPLALWQANHNRYQINTGKNWLAIELVNQSSATVDVQLVLSEGRHIRDASFYALNGGLSMALAVERRINNLLHSQVRIAGHEQVMIYIELESLANSEITLDLVPSSVFNQQVARELFAIGAALGALLFLALLLYVVAWANKQQAILWLASYFLFSTFALSAVYGVNSLSMFSARWELVHIEQLSFTILASIALLLFTSVMFKLAYQTLNLYRMVQFSVWLMVIVLILSLFLPLKVNLLICHLVTLLTFAILSVIGRYLFKIKNNLAPLFIVFVCVQALGVIANLVMVSGGELHVRSATVVYLLSAVVIVFLLARQSALQLTEKYSAQQEALESAMQSKKTHDELLALQAQTQEHLENRVQERTLELNIALQELEEANRELEQKNTLDELTGLYNRRYYEQKILAEFRRSRRNLTPLSLVVIDIDYFKKINDSYGHSAGDTCLAALAKTIKQLIRRSSDIACRYGGEEFCVILPETDNAGALAIANELRQKVEAQVFELTDVKLTMTISCGVSTYTQQAEVTPVNIFDAADKALYQAKHNGRNQVVSEPIAVSHIVA